MARITVEDCIDKFESRFELVLVASNRARKLHSGEAPTVEKDNDKSTVIALREIADESLSVDSLKNKLIEEYQTVSPLDEEDLSLDYVDSETELEHKTNLNEKQLKEVSDEVDIASEKEDEPIDDDNNDSTLTAKNDGYTNISDDNNPEN